MEIVAARPAILFALLAAAASPAKVDLCVEGASAIFDTTGVKMKATLRNCGSEPIDQWGLLYFRLEDPQNPHSQFRVQSNQITLQADVYSHPGDTSSHSMVFSWNEGYADRKDSIKISIWYFFWREVPGEDPSNNKVVNLASPVRTDSAGTRYVYTLQAAAGPVPVLRQARKAESGRHPFRYSILGRAHFGRGCLWFPRPERD